ncbi:MAG: DUF3015 domain-containing protein [SAR324 cluster bacterium]|nr:DUF3015 domain-containing protein [SAR324 cluster bacterium]
MLKRLALIIIASALIPVSYSLAADNGPGCGLGKMIFKDIKGNKKIVHQVIAATLNGTSGNQTFGITSGTSGCTNDGIVKNEEKVNVFVAVNFESLQEDMAQGQGEYLNSLANLMKIPTKHQSEFFMMTRDRYNTLFASPNTTPQEMLMALNIELAADPIL